MKTLMIMNFEKSAVHSLIMELMLTYYHKDGSINTDVSTMNDHTSTLYSAFSSDP